MPDAPDHLQNVPVGEDTDRGRNLNTFYVVVFTFTIPSLQTGMASCLAMTAPGGISAIKPGCKKNEFHAKEQ